MSGDLYVKMIHDIKAEHEHMTTKTLTENPALPEKIASLSALTTMIRQEMQRMMEFKGGRSGKSHQVFIG